MARPIGPDAPQVPSGRSMPSGDGAPTEAEIAGDALDIGQMLKMINATADRPTVPMDAYDPESYIPSPYDTDAPAPPPPAPPSPGEAFVRRERALASGEGRFVERDPRVEEQEILSTQIADWEQQLGAYPITVKDLVSLQGKLPAEHYDMVVKQALNAPRGVRAAREQLKKNIEGARERQELLKLKGKEEPLLHKPSMQYLRQLQAQQGADKARTQELEGSKLTEGGGLAPRTSPVVRQEASANEIPPQAVLDIITMVREGRGDQ